MRVRFWGTRGSIAKAGPSTVRYGGNTSCVEVRSAGGTLIVLDCGTGAHGLGHLLSNQGPIQQHGHILVSHTHWDHIQGFPFFAPFADADNEWHVHGPRGIGSSVREALAGQMQSIYFPVSLEQLAATLHYNDLVEGSFELGDVKVTAQFLNHPALTLGYRIEADGATLVYATDHEPHACDLAVARPDHSVCHREDDAHARFLAGADLLIHDAQYTAEEYPARVGWGHSTVEYAVDTAAAVGVRAIALYHHDPMRDDGSVDALVRSARRRVGAIRSGIEVFAAAEGHAYDLRGPRLTPLVGADAERALRAPETRRSW